MAYSGALATWRGRRMRATVGSQASARPAATTASCEAVRQRPGRRGGAAPPFGGRPLPLLVQTPVPRPQRGSWTANGKSGFGSGTGGQLACARPASHRWSKHRPADSARQSTLDGRGSGARREQAAVRSRESPPRARRTRTTRRRVSRTPLHSTPQRSFGPSPRRFARSQSSYFTGSAQRFSTHAIAETEPQFCQLIQHRPHRFDKAAFLGQQQHADRANHIQPCCRRRPTRSAVVTTSNASGRFMPNAMVSASPLPKLGNNNSLVLDISAIVAQRS